MLNNETKIANFFDSLAPSWDKDSASTHEGLKALLKRFSIKEGDYCLDIACGTGVITHELYTLSKHQVRAIDISKEMVKIAQSKIPSMEAKITCDDFYSFKENGFDVAIIFNAYPHFLDPDALVKKLAEVLKPNGRFIILHDLGLNNLAKCHKHLGDDLSRTLKPAKEEAMYFSSSFKVDYAYDDEHCYYISGIKSR
jgi:demethylmenaquinone methyltransferase/2-methoxy-6-polyprenyl-1,4-benzoquinol methylase